MSTRCHIKFGTKRNGKLVVDAMLYKHSDGYPDGPHGIAAKMQEFFEAVERDTDDTRFDDSEYLAAKFLVWAVMEDKARMEKWEKEFPLVFNPGGKKNGLLDFLSIGISQHVHGDIAYEYFVDCSNYYGRPRVLVRKRGERKYRVLKSESKVDTEEATASV